MMGFFAGFILGTIAGGFTAMALFVVGVWLIGSTFRP